MNAPERSPKFSPPIDFHAAIFDLDGTLLDTLTDIANAANSVLAEHGFPTHSIPQYRLFVGEGVQMLMKRALPPDRQDEATLRACLADMKTAYLRFLNQTAAPYPGIPELLRGLKSRNWRLAVLSNKPHELTGQCVRHFFGDQHFDIIYGLRDGAPRKPDPTGALDIARQWRAAPADVFYLGDSGTDMQTAAAAGMFPAGALWGYRDKHELLANGAKLLLAEPTELLVMVG